MDWPRLLRALDAAGVERIETRRASMLAGKLTADEISADEWTKFGEHDRLAEAWPGVIDGSHE